MGDLTARRREEELAAPTPSSVNKPHVLTPYHAGGNFIAVVFAHLQRLRTVRDAWKPICHLLGAYMSAKPFDSTMLGDAAGALDFITNVLEASTEYSIIGKSIDGTILLWNEGAHRMYGYDAAEVAGKANSEILHPRRRGARAAAQDAGRGAEERPLGRRDRPRAQGSSAIAVPTP